MFPYLPILQNLCLILVEKYIVCHNSIVMINKYARIILAVIPILHISVYNVLIISPALVIKNDYDPVSLFPSRFSP